MDFRDRQLPSGRHGLPAGDVAENQRWRILKAAAEVLVVQGYGAATSRRISDRAGVSPTTFYVHFEGVDACFLAAHAVASDCVWELTSAACARSGSWSERLRAALDAIAGFLAAEPALARLLCADLAAGIPAVADARQTLLERLAGLLRSGRRPGLESTGELPPGAEAHLVGGAVSLLGDRIVAGEVASLPALRPELAEILAAPYKDPSSVGRCQLAD